MVYFLEHLNERTYYTNKDIKYVFGDKIVEYDLREAGYSCVKRYNLCQTDTINRLEKMNKKARHIEIGKLIIKDKELGKNIKKHIAEARYKFLTSNKIEEDKILSIKNDAIYIIGEDVGELEFDGLEFRNKRQYFAFMNINKNEFYIADDIVDVKGINDNLTKFHQDFMLDFFRDFANRVSNSDYEKQVDFIKEVAYLYRNYELDTRYYRELNTTSLFRPKVPVKIMGTELGYEFYDKDPRDLNISYNYMNYIIPLYQYLV